MSNPDDVYEDASTSMKEYVQNVKPLQKQKRQRRKRRLILLVAAVAMIIAAGSWFVFRKSRPEPRQPVISSQSENKEEEAAEEKVVTETDRYVSQAFSLSLDHPRNWEVDDTEATRLVISSPVTKLKTSDGTSDAKVVIVLRPTGSQLTEFTSNSVAIRPSQKMTYIKPSSQQRGQTYLSFVSHKGNGLDGVYITGDFGYEKDGFVPKVDVSKGQPIVSVMFLACPNNNCDLMTAASVAVDENEWENNTYLKQAREILESLTIS